MVRKLPPRTTARECEALMELWHKVHPRIEEKLKHDAAVRQAATASLNAATPEMASDKKSN